MMRYNGEPCLSGDLGISLGTILANQAQAIRLLERLNDNVQELPAKLAASAPLPVPARSTRLAELTDFVKAMQPMILLALLVAAKVMWPELWPFIRRLVADM